MSKHAPGPWELTHTEQMGFRVSDSTGWGVAVVLKDTNDDANARLMAAAPQMLEALEMAVDAMESADRQGAAGLQMAVEIALEAIAAAKGEA
jgi:hypothetical protein